MIMIELEISTKRKTLLKCLNTVKYSTKSSFEKQLISIIAWVFAFLPVGSPVCIMKSLIFLREGISNAAHIFTKQLEKVKWSDKAHKQL